MACLVFGDSLWFLQADILGIEPFPSIADVFYLGFYPLVAASFLSLPGRDGSRGARLRTWLDAGTVFLGAWMVLWYFVVGPVATRSGASPSEVALALAYPTGDLLLFFGVVMVAIRRPSALPVRTMVLLGLGALLFATADSAFATLELQGSYMPGSWPDLVWMGAHLSFAYSAVSYSTHRGKSNARRRREPAIVSWVPYLMVIAGYAMLLVAARDQGPYPLGGLLVAAVALTGIVTARQILVMRENAALLERLHELAATDGLTGLRNRRSLMELGEAEFSLAAMLERPIACIVLDVDRFKEVNDLYGHETGDAVLVAVADGCRGQIRAGDIIGRPGGDELAIILPGSGSDEAQQVAERICRAVEARPVRVGDRLVPVTISLGVADSRGAGSVAEMLARADGALYCAKAAGRNRLHVAESA